jgi:hypothetical protein
VAEVTAAVAGVVVEASPAVVETGGAVAEAGYSLLTLPTLSSRDSSVRTSNAPAHTVELASGTGNTGAPWGAPEVAHRES